MEIIYTQKYNNYIVFTHNDMDGLFSAIIIKAAFDNNLENDAWERNVTCYTCTYGKKYDLNWFKEKVNEAYVEGMNNVVYMTDYAIQPNNIMLNFWNWLTDKGCQFFWIDHHITAIENLKHLNIPGLQFSGNSGAMNTWKFLHPDEEAPFAIKLANDFDIWNKKSVYNWDKQLFPFTYFINSLGIQLNDNSGELVQTLTNMLTTPQLTEKAIEIGKYIWNFIKNQYNLSAHKIYNFMWNDYNCLCVNSSFSGSTQFQSYENYKDYDLLITWSYNGKTFGYGIYSTKPHINCGEIAQMYLNGGGHKGAGGGDTKEFIFHNLIN